MIMIITSSAESLQAIVTPLFVREWCFILGKVEICGVNTATLPVLKSGETRALLEKSRAGDKAAREQLISGNLRLVLSVVQRFANRGESMDDLFQVGCIGLIKAIDAFDLGQNVQFSTYGVPAIMGWRNMRQTPTPSPSASSGQSAPLLRPFSLQYTKYSCGKAPSPEHGFSRNLLSPTGSSSA